MSLGDPPHEIDPHRQLPAGHDTGAFTVYKGRQGIWSDGCFIDLNKWDLSNPDNPIPPPEVIYDDPFGPRDLLGPLPRYEDNN